MILCAGEALIDMLPAGDGFKPVAGGAALNSAVAIRRLGQEVALACGVSTDQFGQRLIQLIEAENIHKDWLQLSPQPQTLAFVFLDNGNAAYEFYDENSAAKAIVPWAINTPPQAALFGGISLAIAPCAAHYEALYSSLANLAVPLMLDLNIRPAAVHDAPTYRARLARMIQHAHIVKASDEDLAWFGMSAQEIYRQTGALICHTQAENGVHLYGPQGDLYCPAPSAKVVDTIGAGDTFNGALLTGLSEMGRLNRSAIERLTPDQLRPILQFATQAASLSVERAGATPPRRNELPDLTTTNQAQDTT